MKHVVISGGAGFLGSHLCDAFLDAGYAVTAIDSFASGRMSNLKEALKRPQFQLIEADIAEPWSTSRLKWIEEHGLAGVLHFAGSKDSRQALRIGSIGTMNCVDLAEHFGARMVLGSSMRVYGVPAVNPQQEAYFGNVDSTGPRAAFDESVRFAEACVSAAIRERRLNGAIARVFQTYGPRMRAESGTVVAEFCLRALQGEPLPIFGDGRQTRGLCHVYDVVRALLGLFESDFTVPINIGNPRESSVLEVAEMVRALTGTRSSLEYLPTRVEDPRRRCPDIELAQTLLQWRPLISLERGLPDTISFFREWVIRVARDQDHREVGYRDEIA